MNLILTGGNIAERLLRNRGRTRALVAAWNLRRLEESLRRFLAGEWKPAPVRRTSPYAISLTSWSRRLNDLQLTLVTLIKQDVRPAAIYVWLTEEDLALVPMENRRLFETEGVRFKSCPDYRSHKKWLPLILSGHREPFVVCDDDIFYPREWFGRLVAEDRGDAYVGCKCHRMSSGRNGLPKSYSEWEKEIYHREAPSELLFTTGCGGEILHPVRLSERALDWGAINEHALFADDVWLKGAHLAGGISVFKTRYCFPCLELPGTDESGLLANHNSGRNDEQIKAVWDYFGLRVRN
jgi:hypothetical protein